MKIFYLENESGVVNLSSKHEPERVIHRPIPRPAVRHSLAVKGIFLGVVSMQDTVFCVQNVQYMCYKQLFFVLPKVLCANDVQYVCCKTEYSVAHFCVLMMCSTCMCTVNSIFSSMFCVFTMCSTCGTNCTFYV